MKLISLKLYNINSLKGEHFVSFEAAPLGAAGLFAITGPTGSGKSTLLDAISLALYNRIPRISKSISKREISETGSILTRNTKEAYVEVVYESKAGRFQSRWSIAVARTGNLKDYHMEIANDKTKDIFPLKKGQVPAKNEDLIGLSYDQFIRSILLAQGEFAKFLNAQRKERAELLESITGSNIYRQIGKKAYSIFTEENKSLIEDNKKITELEKKLISEEELYILEKDSKNLNDTLKQYRSKKNNIAELLGRIDQIEKQKLELDKTKEQLKIKANYSINFNNTQGIIIQKHRSLLPYAKQLNNWQKLNDELLKIESQKLLNKKKINNSKEELERIHLISEKLVKKPIKEKELFKTLEKFQKEVQKLQEEKIMLGSLYREQAASAKSNAQQLNIELTKPNFLAEQIRKLLEQQKNNSSKLNDLIQKIDKNKTSNPSEIISENNKFKERFIRLENLQEDINDFNKRLKKEDEYLKEKKARIEALPNEISQLIVERKIKDTLLQLTEKDLKIKQLENKLENQRHLLENGEPCPLCGSEAHPYSSNYIPPDIKSLEDKVKEIKNELHLLSNKISGLQSEKEQINKGIIENKMSVEEYQKSIASTKKEIKDLIQLLPKEHQKLNPTEAIKKITLENENLSQYKKLKDEEAPLKLLIPILNKMLESIKKGKEKAAELKAKFDGESIDQTIQEIKIKFTEDQNNLEHVKNNLNELIQKENQINSETNLLQINLSKDLNNLGYKQLAEAKNELLNEHEFASLSEQENQIKLELQELTVKEKEQEKNLQILTKENFAESPENLTKQITELNLEIEKTEIKQQNNLHRVKTQDELKKEIQTLKNSTISQRKKIRKWELLNKYIGDSEGKNFSMFAQDLTLQQLVYLANLRLAQLNGRYLLAMPKKGEDDSLSVVDKDMGHQRRSVKTLSGGESFLMSLSLALALSDLTSQHIEINCLFIDEGFGTLDAETLDSTLDTLEKLQSESQKTIGIISHVESLKERINTQIELIQNGQGYSQILIKPEQF